MNISPDLMKMEHPILSINNRSIMEFICPNSSSSSVWGFSPCFNDMVLGFGVNLITILVIIACFLFTPLPRTRRATRNTMLYNNAPHKNIFWYILPSLGACLSLYDILLLSKRALEHHYVPYYQWSFPSSHFFVWVIIMWFWRRHYWILLLSNRLFCFWWIAKPLLAMPHLFSLFSSKQVINLSKESFSILVDAVFGVFVNVIRVTHASTENRNYSLADPLLACEADCEEFIQRDINGSAFSYWDILTFKAISSVMDRGSKKQLEFDDLILVPAELDSSSCYNALLNSWVLEQSRSYSHPSLFRAICYAYGWPYFCIGLLKVFNDCIGFAGPLLLNRLIWFLQKGSGNLDGYILALSLGLSSIFKSFLDTQYTFHLSKLKLQLRSGIMTVIYWKCLCVSSAERSNFSEGEIQTFMSVDAERTINLCNSLHDAWSLPLQIGVALYLLYTQVKFAFIAGITITILLIPVNRWLSILIARATEEMMKHKDESEAPGTKSITSLESLRGEFFKDQK